METEVILSLGSNLGDREGTIREAILLIEAECGRLIKAGRLYETEPLGFSAESDFLNTCIKIKTPLSVVLLLNRLKLIEKELGREKKSTDSIYSSRTIDIDIIFYGNEIVRLPELVIPHPRYHQRKFVLLPLNDIDATLKDPENGRKVSQMLQDCIDESAISVYKNDFL